MGRDVRLALRPVLQRDQVSVHPLFPLDSRKGQY